MKKLLYPKIPRQLQKRCKLTDQNIKEIRQLYKNHSKNFLAKMFNVSKSTISYWVDDAYRQKDIEKAQNRMKKKRSDPEMKRLLNLQRAEEIKDARKRIPELAIYHKQEKII